MEGIQPATGGRNHSATLYNLYIYMSEECNLACKHCWITARLSDQIRLKPVPVESYFNFIDQAIGLGLGYVKISGGEAFLRKQDVLRLIEFTHERKIATRIETNGTLIDDEIARTIHQTKTAVSISLDGATAEQHERVRQIPGCFDATMRGIDLLKRYEVPIEIVMSIYQANEHDLVNVIKFTSTIKRGRLKINPVMASGRGQKMDSRGERLNVLDLFHLMKKVETDYINYGVPILASSEPAFHSLTYIVKRLVGGGKCGFKSLLGILANGDVSFCGMGYKTPELVFGHVSDIELAKVWQENAILQEIRARIPDGLEGVCGNCILKRGCQGGCRSNAYELFGSITAPSPACQDLYDAGLFPNSRLIEPSRDSSYRPKKAMLNVLN